MEVMAEVAQRLVAAAAIATAGAPNEASLRQELESSLRQSSEVPGISGTPFRLDLTLRTDRRAIFADVAHGAVVIEYESPRAFHGVEGAVLAHARDQSAPYLPQRRRRSSSLSSGDGFTARWLETACRANSSAVFCSPRERHITNLTAMIRPLISLPSIRTSHWWPNWLLPCRCLGLHKVSRITR